ncbi:methylenetetrahydrofolate reductase [NAD(P)H] [Pseudobutyrivibrio xylanivorans]|uniref:Methylenetetrahydrofolate reductase n=1 Tax=Pseudobutyrivibrio xylanivorans DSM 14809 TaxID=1123012 RepID=A0A1M6F9K7_PSEXY|nr:methylenetetrahydrofolate reductase [NAD(P)H] [Pseudobutyrivibrio xylanivorans]SHI94377.1 methylenetetrahydrofolate reductase (NADPH) [Pseudobutyrivibrio xylanivorans DSM 14809]
MFKDMFERDSSLSFEVFPPKKDDEFENCYNVLDSLAEINPDFISVTYGAGGSRSKKTVDIASYIQNQLKIDAMAHMTCVGSSEEDILAVTRDLEAVGVNHVLALRGDKPRDMSDEQFEQRIFPHATDLIHFINQNTNLIVSASCYPEKHPEAISMDSDIAFMKMKQDMGAEMFISQLFFDNADFYRFIERTRRAEITVPIVAGIMPITSAKQIGSTVTLAGSSVPKKLADICARYGDSPDDMRKAGIAYAIDQINDLKRCGMGHIHIYCMNKPKMTKEICDAI